MNSMSRGYNYCGRESKKEDRCPVIVKGGCPSTVQVPAVTLDVVTPTQITLASLTVDASCICDPVIKIDFTSIYTSLVGLAVSGTTIQIFKQCKNQMSPTPVGPSWPVSTPIAISLAETKPVSFFVYDNDTCDEGCCTYTAVATVTGIAGAALGASYNNSTLSALITCKDSCRKCK